MPFVPRYAACVASSGLKTPLKISGSFVVGRNASSARQSVAITALEPFSTASGTVAEADPGIFTLNGSGTGPGAIINQDGTINSASNPAARGSVISIYASGGGISNLQLTNGQLVGSVLPSPLLTVEAFIASEASAVLYAGGAPGEIAGLLQVNAQVPSDVQVGFEVPIQLRVGGVFSQPGVTVAIK
jgi:uncharacterized protein (TIGR03437 family)